MKTFALFVVVLLVGIFIAVKYQGNTVEPAHAQANGPEDVPVVQPTKTSQKVQTSEMRSSKADKRIVLRSTTQDDATTYAFFITDITGANERLFYTKNLPAGASMEIPYNTWDPTDTYLFLQENGQGIQHFYVFKASGEPFANGEKFIDVNAIWANKTIPYAIRTATGWASGTLLIVYTAKEDGTKGPPYWFEIPSTAIIQLAR